MHIVIVGAGIAGLSAALALTKFVKSVAKITVIEHRSKISANSGVININLTPRCQRYLHRLGAHQKIEEHGFGAEVKAFDFVARDGGVIASLDCSNAGKGFGDPAFNCRRILRAELMQSLCETVEEQDAITIEYEQEIAEIKDDGAQVILRLTDGSEVCADLLLGCDGVHSTIRSRIVAPSHKATYTACVAASAFVEVASKDKEQLPFNDTCVVFAQRGRFVSSFHNQARNSVFLGGLFAQTDEPTVLDGWTAVAKDQDDIRNKMASQFSDTSLTWLKGLIGKATDWHLYPIYVLTPQCPWVGASGRVVLLGDAAHAMPPQGEAAGIAIEDAVCFGRMLGEAVTSVGEHGPDVKAVAIRYEAFRQPMIGAAYTEAYRRWDGAEDSGWFGYKLRVWLLPVLMKLMMGKNKAAWERDLTVGALK